MKHRKLRMAFSAVCGVICLMLLALWVRSYSVPLRLLRANAARTEAIGVQSDGGRFVVGKFKLPGMAPPNSVLDATLANDRTFAILNQQLAEEQAKAKDPRRSARDSAWIAERRRSIAVLQQGIAQWRAKVSMAMAGPQSIRPHALSVALPHWFLLLVAATLAAVPWTNWRFRFGLRTLLIAATIIGLTLGLIFATTR
jgi:hypothetical protein